MSAALRPDMLYRGADSSVFAALDASASLPVPRSDSSALGCLLAVTTDTNAEQLRRVLPPRQALSN